MSINQYFNKVNREIDKMSNEQIVQIIESCMHKSYECHKTMGEYDFEINEKIFDTEIKELLKLEGD